jgi:tRNA threonylcarbamoyl adenosine modification protein (Sua5/YciO/YrdC/YwlC family)
MIEKIVPSNIDDRVINRAVTLLEEGALIALPTDTSWTIVCSIKSPAAIKKLRRLSGERDERHFTLLCSSISQFSEMCNLSNSRFRMIKSLSPGPYVFILKTQKGTEKVLDIRRHEVGVRIPNYPVPIRLIETIGYPLYSITAKKSMTAHGGPETFGDEQADTELPPIPEKQLFENAHELADIKELDMILDSGEDRERIFSTILDMCQDEIKLLRLGAGHWPV